MSIKARPNIRYANLGDTRENIDTMRSIEHVLEDIENSDPPEEITDDDYAWPTTSILEDTAD